MGLLDLFTGAASKRAASNNQYAISSGTKLGGDALTTGYSNAQGLLGTGDGSNGNALSALGGGYADARNDLNNQYGATQNYLGQAGAAYQPLVSGGANAYNALLNATGANGAAGSAEATANFTASPGYQYGLDQALGAVQRSAASRGGLAGGNATSDILKTANGLASQGYQQYVQNLQNLTPSYQAGIAGQANALTGQASASQAQGNALSALGTGYGTTAAGIYGTGSQQQVGFGQNVAGLQTGATNALVQNNNNLAASENAAGANILGAALGVGQLFANPAGAVAGKAAGGLGNLGTSTSGSNPFSSLLSSFNPFK